ncbi:failed axon connections homolog [Styela clava]|uniref:failed axon connections homolog n=1 Tax=Styela clava TaxID=7725 RepID=UPI00193A95E9|nr:failed axon connections homolog [Styela clava]
MPATTTAASSDDGVVFCHTGPSRVAPSLSSFVLKLETYLRMTEIPYKEEVSLKKSPKGKIPFVKIDGKDLGDTNFIIPYLNKKYEKDLDASLNLQEKSISLAFKRLIEENLYWTMVHYRWVENYSSFSKIIPVTGFYKKIMPIAGAMILKPNVKSNLNGHGMGRHSVKEIHEISANDLKALSDYLGDKQFFMGENPTEIDASLFGLLAQFRFTMPESEQEKLMKDDLKNLGEYTDRMRDRYFSDWEEKLLQEKKKVEEVPETKKAESEGEKNGSGDKVEEKEEKNGSGDKVEENEDKKEEAPKNGSKVEEVAGAQDGKQVDEEKPTEEKKDEA